MKSSKSRFCIYGAWGITEALIGLGLSYGLTADRYAFERDFEWKKDDGTEPLSEIMNRLALLSCKLSWKQGGHNKFLEQIICNFDINAPRYWWSQFDTYRVGISKSSESTMHTLLKTKRFTQDMFSYDINETYLDVLNLQLNKAKDNNDLSIVKTMLPEGFLQRRIGTINFKTLQNIIEQRKNHRLPEWHEFIDCIYSFLNGGVSNFHKRALYRHYLFKPDNNDLAEIFTAKVL